MTSTIDQIIKLIDAGYTKDEISALIETSGTGTTPNPDKPAAQETNDHQETKGETLKAPESTSQNVSDDSTTKALEELTSTINSLVKAQQASNRAGTSNVGRVYETTDDILAGIINPKN